MENQKQDSPHEGNSFSCSFGCHRLMLAPHLFLIVILLVSLSVLQLNQFARNSGNGVCCLLAQSQENEEGTRRPTITYTADIAIEGHHPQY